MTDSRQTDDSASRPAPPRASGQDLNARLRLLPPRTLPLVYFAVARVAFMAALLAVALDPTMAAGFFYQPRLIAAVHLVTIGWLTFSIYASLYLVGPLALRVALPARAMDYVVCALAASGLAAAIAGFWRNDLMAAGWWAALVLPAAAWLAARVMRALWTSPVQPAVKLHIGLAFVNFFAAGSLGVAMGMDRARDLLTTPPLANLYTHAHVAAVGWVGLMAVGVGYRLFPMVLPAAMPEGRSLYVSALLIEGGLVLLAIGLLRHTGPLIPLAALGIAAGFGAFLVQVRRMLAERRPPPVAMRWPEYGALQSIAALVCLALALALGVYLSIAPVDVLTPRLALAYGVLGLVGFLAQLVAGMEYRLLPFLAWYWAFANTGFKGPVPNPHEMPIPGVQRTCFFLWVAGVPLLALGVAWPLPRLISTGAWLLLLAVAAATIDAAAVASLAYRKMGSAPVSRA